MTRHVSAWPAVYSRVKTKKDLKQAAKEGFNAELHIEDPLGIGSGIMGLNEIPEDISVTVTNHPKRTWFATVTRKDGKVRVT
jgi:hypothetical protein